MIILRLLELMNRVAVIDGISRQVNQITRVVTQQAGADQLGRFRVRAHLAKTKIIAGQVQHPDVATFR